MKQRAKLYFLAIHRPLPVGVPRKGKQLQLLHTSDFSTCKVLEMVSPTMLPTLKEVDLCGTHVQTSSCIIPSKGYIPFQDIDTIMQELSHYELHDTQLYQMLVLRN